MFTTNNNAFFNKASTISINKQGTSMNQDWSVVHVGDEVRIMYYEDQISRLTSSTRAPTRSRRSSTPAVPS